MSARARLSRLERAARALAASAPGGSLGPAADAVLATLDPAAFEGEAYRRNGRERAAYAAALLAGGHAPEAVREALAEGWPVFHDPGGAAGGPEFLVVDVGLVPSPTPAASDLDRVMEVAARMAAAARASNVPARVEGVPGEARP